MIYIQKGDYVKIKNDNENCIYIIKEMISSNDRAFLLSGFIYRVSIIEKEDNLILASDEEIKQSIEKEKSIRNKIIKKDERKVKKRYLLGTVMHIDGDEEYLNKCLELYEELGVYSYGKCISEDKIHLEIGKYLIETNADIVVITGHDIYNNKGLKDINNYLNTMNFIKAIKEVRKLRNDCVVIAGACQSNFEALIANGADFASSPKRINIHTFDPAIVAIKVATTSFNRIVEENDLFKYIENEKDAIGGLQTKGKMRILL